MPLSSVTLYCHSLLALFIIYLWWPVCQEHRKTSYNIIEHQNIKYIWVKIREVGGIILYNQNLFFPICFPHPSLIVLLHRASSKEQRGIEWSCRLYVVLPQIMPPFQCQGLSSQKHFSHQTALLAEQQWEDDKLFYKLFNRFCFEHTRLGDHWKEKHRHRRNVTSYHFFTSLTILLL